jgi:Tol biopolymer transport system component/tRNA A-37 threonylcarbamoyl transferase component Bud32
VIPERLAAALADRYRLERELGQGGMATVYLAEDLKHDRKVALKVLRPELAAVLGADRFLVEIKTTANLQHPHILALFDSGKVDGTVFYVMPFVEGESLRDRLAREKQLPVADAIRIASEVAGALDYAHRRGVIHRDIKPENILLHDDSALVADFGIALAASRSEGSTRLTETGMSLGTPHYMSPEQAMGEREITARSDVYALGCVLYEMLTGEPPYTGPTAQAVVAKVMTAEPPPPSAARKAVPPSVDEAVLTALEKLPADRFASAAEFAAVLAGGGPPRRRRTGASGDSRRWTGRTVTTAGAVALVVGVAIGAMLFGRQGARPRFGLASKVTFETTLEIHPALSPDGRYLAYAAGDALRTRVYVRQVDGGRPTLLTDDSSANEVAPSWSPDGSRILYASPRGVFSVPASGGHPRPEAPPSASGPIVSTAWSPDGRTIAYVVADSIFLKGAGEASRFLATSYSLTGCRWSPDGSRLACAAGNALYTTVGALYGNLAPGWVEVVDARTGARTALTDSVALNHSPAWSSGGQWVYFVSNRDGTNDIYRTPATGGPIHRVTVGLGAQSIAISSDGSRLAYNVYHTVGNMWSVPFGPRPMGLRGATQVTRGNQSVEIARVSFDGRTLYYGSDISGTAQLYRIPVTGGEPERLTTDGQQDFAPAPSPDEQMVAFHSPRAGSRDIYLLPLDGRPLMRITDSPDQELAADWAPDGSAIAYGRFDAAGGIRVQRRQPDGSFGRPVERSPFGMVPAWSPDGRWIAFVTQASGGQLYVVGADSGMPRLLVDTIDRAAPRSVWTNFSRDGREIMFSGVNGYGVPGIWSVPFPAGKPLSLVLRYDDPVRRPSNPYWALSRERLFVLLQESESDIWVMETDEL